MIGTKKEEEERNSFHFPVKGRRGKAGKRQSGNRAQEQRKEKLFLS